MISCSSWSQGQVQAGNGRNVRVWLGLIPDEPLACVLLKGVEVRGLLFRALRDPQVLKPEPVAAWAVELAGLR
jgi:hypothetical protein